MAENPKIFSWSFVGWLAALLSSMSAILVFVGWLLKPHINDYIISVHEAHEKSEEDPSKKSLRSLISEETNIPEDRVHIVIGQWWHEHKELQTVLDEVYPILEEEVTCIIPKLIITSNRRAKWLHTDGEIYDASISNDGFYWFYHPTQGWLPCKV